ncbi:hypothetical protein, partial [uncultured Gammaproteobacteria bacterium]
VYIEQDVFINDINCNHSYN